MKHQPPPPSPVSCWEELELISRQNLADKEEKKTLSQLMPRLSIVDHLSFNVVLIVIILLMPSEEL